MKKTLTLFILALALQVSAQTITYSNYAACLTSTLNANIANPSSYNTALNTTTGTGVTWDASGITQQTGTPTVHLIYVAPSGTPNGSLYTASNYVQYDPALTSVVGYNYFNISADSIVRIGSYEPSAAHEIYQNPDKHLIFPFTYLQSFTDDYSKTNYSDATTVSSIQTGTRTVTFSGYGTLILPQGSFSNVALIHELRTNSLGPNSNTYTWFDISNGKQLMFYEENAGSLTIAYTADAATGIADNEPIYTTSVYPNPMTTTSTLKINSNEAIVNAELKICDMLGKEVKSMLVNSNEISINREALNNGLYFYTLTQEGKKLATGKLVVE